MLIKATLSNAMHPEYGEVTIPFPIKTSEYDRTMEMLANLEIGNVMGRDCKIMELSSPYSILQKLEGSEVNIDELDYLAKRLESFEADQDLQFQAAAFARGVASIEDFINLTFCSDQATVIYDFTKLEEAGRQHFMNLHGGCASTEELENLDGYETALLLIDGGGAEITPYGVLYDNGMQMEQLYKGGPFPPYLYDAYELVLPVSPTQSPQNKTYLYLPSSNLQLERTLLRGGIMEREGWFHKLEPIQLSSVITAKLDTRRDSIRELNEMCRSIHLLSHVDRSKLDAAVEYAQAKTASQIRKVAEHLDQFDFAPGVHTPEEYGRYMIRDSGHFNYDSKPVMDTRDLQREIYQIVDQTVGLLDRFEEYCSAAQKDIDLADGHEVFTAIHRQISHSLDNAITGLSCWVAELENMQEKQETGLLQHKETDDLTLSM